MSRTLNLCDHLLHRTRNLFALGLEDRALPILTDLSRLRDLPPAAAEETQARLGEVLLNQRKFAKARRHITAALAHDDSNAAHHHLMASANAEDRRGQAAAALEHYRRAVELDPENAQYHVDAGLFALRRGNVELGLGWLRRGIELAPANVEIVWQVVRGLVDAGQAEEARQTARTALFHNSQDPRFRQLWNDFRFQELHRSQQRARKRRFIRGAIAEGRICLPFEQMTTETATGRRMMRQDGPSRTPAPHFLRLRLSDRKHA